MNKNRGTSVNIEDLRFSFISREEKFTVIQDLSLQVNPNEIIVLLGPSGCGKTTIIKTLAGLLRETDPNVSISGKIELGGIHPSDFLEKENVEFFFQEPVLLPWLTLIDNLLLPFKLNGKHIPKESIHLALTSTGLAGFEKFYPKTLSGGMKQRAVLARALLRRPSLILMDEPFGSLDDQTRENMDFVFLDFLKQWPCTVIFVTHNIREAAILGDRLVILQQRPTNVVKIVKGVDRSRRRSTNLAELIDIERTCKEALMS